MSSHLWKFKDLVLAILDWILKCFLQIISGIEPSFNSNVFSFIIFMYMKAALGQGEFMDFCVQAFILLEGPLMS